MSHFYGSMKGNRGEATRQGTKNSGFYAHIRGWNVGVSVSLRHCKEKDCDVVVVHKTGGSNGGMSEKLIGEFCECGKDH